MNRKLKDYADEHGVVYRTAWNRFKKGKIPGAYMDDTGHIIVPLKNPIDLTKVAIYARVSSSQNKNNLLLQSARLKEYATAKGYQIVTIVEEIGSGVNDNRKKLKKLLLSEKWGTLIVEHKDRLTRFGFNYLDIMIGKNGRKIEVVNLAEDEQSDLIHDLMAVIYSFGAKLYGLRRSKRKTENIIMELKNDS